MNGTITYEQQQAISSLNRVFALIEMVNRTFAEDEEPGSREKLLTSLYMLEDTAKGCKTSIKEAFS